MRLTTSLFAGFIAVGAATPAGLAVKPRLAVKPTPTRDSIVAAPAQPTPPDGNWHIGCDAKNHCSYYQDSDISAGYADSLPLRTITLSEAKCKQCTSQDPCDHCSSAYSFHCRDCDHYECKDEFVYQRECFDIQPELAYAIRNGTITATIYATATSTTVETSSTVTTLSSVQVTTITVTPTTTIFFSPLSESTITSTRTAFSSRHSGLAPHNKAASNDADTRLPVRRNAAFKQSQCVPCGFSTCPECHNDCPGCEKFLCTDLDAHLTTCMSVRSKWQPPSFNISDSVPSDTTTVVVMPQPETTTTTTTTTQKVTYLTTISAIPTPLVSTVTEYPQASQISTVVLAPPRPQLTTIVVAPPQLQPETVTVQKPASTVTQHYQDPASTVIIQQPGTASTVTQHYQDPASTVIIQQPGTASTVTQHYQDPASTIIIQPPTVTVSSSPSEIVVPMTIISTATQTVVKSVRALPTSAPALVKSSCESCDGNPDCDGSGFSCDGSCEHFLCKAGLNGEDIFMSFAEDVQASRAYDASLASGDYLGSAAMLLVLNDGGDLAANVSTIRSQPEVSNSTRPNFVFNEDDCHLCESGDESCDMCDWQFNCGMKKKCFHNGAREIVEMCFEKGEKCRP